MIAGVGLVQRREPQKVSVEDDVPTAPAQMPGGEGPFITIIVENRRSFAEGYGRRRGWRVLKG